MANYKIKRELSFKEFTLMLRECCSLCCSLWLTILLPMGEVWWMSDTDIRKAQYGGERSAKHREKFLCLNFWSCRKIYHFTVFVFLCVQKPASLFRWQRMIKNQLPCNNQVQGAPREHKVKITPNCGCEIIIYFFSSNLFSSVSSVQQLSHV